MSEIRRGTDTLGFKFEWPSEMITEIIKDYGQIEQAIRDYDVSYQELENKLRQRDEGQRKNNIIIFGKKIILKSWIWWSSG
jgi:effector-binding domain-containing protein